MAEDFLGQDKNWSPEVKLVQSKIHKLQHIVKKKLVNVKTSNVKIKQGGGNTSKNQRLDSRLFNSNNRSQKSVECFQSIERYRMTLLSSQAKNSKETKLD